MTLQLKTRWRDGTTHILMEPRDLIDRLVPLIPSPRAHQVRYHGILAPAASLRSRVVPNEELGTTPVANTDHVTESESVGARSRRLHWALLLQRVFAIDALRCPRCGATMRLLAAIEDESVACAILESVGVPARAPPRQRPRSDLGLSLDFDPPPADEG